RQQQRSKLYTHIAVSTVVIALLCVAVSFAMPHNQIWIRLLFLLLIPVGILSFLGGLQSITDRQKTTANALAMFEDIRTVGPLAEALEFTQENSLVKLHTPKIAASTLTRLLPNLQPTDAELLNAEQRACLCRALGTNNIGLSLAILKAF